MDAVIDSSPPWPRTGQVGIDGWMCRADMFHFSTYIMTKAPWVDVGAGSYHGNIMSSVATVKLVLLIAFGSGNASEHANLLPCVCLRCVCGLCVWQMRFRSETDREISSCFPYTGERPTSQLVPATGEGNGVVAQYFGPKPCGDSASSSRTVPTLLCTL